MFGRGRSNDHRAETGTPVDDAALVRIAQADLREFAALYDRYVDAIYRYCYRRSGNAAQAEDATSATFYKALAALPGFDNRPGAFRPWLFSIAHNVVVDQARARQRRPEANLDDRPDLISAEPDPEEAVIAADEAQRLAVAMNQLPEDQKQILTLRLAGLSGPEIASALDRSPGAVRVAQHRAIGRLRNLLATEPAPSETRKEARGD
ncbi:MAG: sigma-70 family RNA polymerase sigma factor [Thermomicrobiales bacterium]|nr:sigma-70 family RNA polymerase sigma factor [Thermomicrobiales bacterium]